MATPTIVLLNAGGLTDGVLTDADTNTGWTDLTTADTDIKVEGTASMSGIFRTDGEQGYYDSGTAPVTAAGKILRGWINTNNLPYMNLEATDPYKLLAFDGTTTELKALFGSDTYPGGWFYFWQGMDDFTTLTLANVRRWGFESGHATNGKNVVNTWADVMRYMDGYYLTGGTSGDKITFLTTAASDKTSAYGIVQNSFGVYFCTGTIQIGNGATTTWFESDGDVVVFLDTPGGLSIPAGLYEINAQGSGCNCVIINSVLRANGTGTTTRFVLDFSDTNVTLNFSGNLVNRASTVTFASGQTAQNNTFDDCGQITHAGADMDGCIVKNYEGTAGTAALIYNVAADPDGEMDNMSFIKGTAATHAIEFGTSTPSSITLRGIDFSGYNATTGQNDSALYISDSNTGNSYTINLIGCSGNISYRTAGASVTLVQDPVTVLVNTINANTGADIQSARVLLEVASGAGGWPYLASVSVSVTATTATVTHTAHGLSSNDKVRIRGLNQAGYNGVKTITVTGANTYTYTVVNDGAATGSPTSTFVVLEGTTDVNGEISASYTFAAATPVVGKARLNSGAGPYYITANISATVSNTAGLSYVASMVPDS